MEISTVIVDVQFSPYARQIGKWWGRGGRGGVVGVGTVYL